jgi:hypothetical protein
LRVLLIVAFINELVHIAKNILVFRCLQLIGRAFIVSDLINTTNNNQHNSNI